MKNMTLIMLVAVLIATVFSPMIDFNISRTAAAGSMIICTDDPNAPDQELGLGHNGLICLSEEDPNEPEPEPSDDIE